MLTHQYLSPDWQLISAAENDDPDVVQRLLQEGADIKGKPGEGALVIAIMCEYDDMVELLLAKSANPYAGGGEALCVAAGQGDLDTVSAFWIKALMSASNHFGHTPLSMAEQQVALVQQQGRNEAVKDLTEVVKLLKERGAN